MAKKSRLATLKDVEKLLKEYKCSIPNGYLIEISETLKEKKKPVMPTISTLRAVIVSCYEFWGKFFEASEECENFTLACVKSLCNGNGVCIVTSKKNYYNGISIYDYTSSKKIDSEEYKTRVCWDWEHVVYSTPKEDGFVEPFIGIVRRVYSRC